jgi:transcriptional regulator of acetoin/glycerol metabolism
MMRVGQDAKSDAEQFSPCCPYCGAPLLLAHIFPKDMIRLISNTDDISSKEPLKALEKYMICRVINEAGSLTRAAKLLGIGRTTLYRRRKKYAITNTKE